MKKILLCLILFTLPEWCEAQHLPLFTQYREQAGILNPAAVHGDYLAFEHNVAFSGSYRRQWVGLAAAPTTQVLQGQYMYAERGSFGWIAGGYLMNDQTGPIGYTGAYGRVAGIITDDPYYGGLSFGLSIGAVQYRVDVNEIKLREDNDILTMDNQAKLYPDVGLGAYFYRQLESGWFDGNHVYVGLSVPQVFGLNLEFKDETGAFSTKRVQHFYGQLGMLAYLDGDSFLEPSVWIKYAPNAPVNADFNLRYQMQSNFWLGTGVSTAGNFHLEFGYIALDFLADDSNLKIGYGYDYSFSSFGPDVGSTHEFNVVYTFEH
jgi:type IX secretion system PorP/SprF family membrane protein